MGPTELGIERVYVYRCIPSSEKSTCIPRSSSCRPYPPAGSRRDVTFCTYARATSPEYSRHTKKWSTRPYVTASNP